MILQLSYSDINKKSWIFFHAFSLSKTKALPPKFTFKFRLPICGQGNKEKFGVFGRITWFFLFFLKEMDPHLGHWQNQKQRSKLLNFALTKKRFYPNKSHFCRSVCFPVSWYKLQESTGTAGLQHKEVKPKDPATNLDDGKLKFQAPEAAPAASPGAGEMKPQAPAATPAILVPRKAQPEPQEKPGTPGEAREPRGTSCQPGAQQKCSWRPQEAVTASLGPTQIKNF